VARDVQRTAEGWSVTTDDGDNLVAPCVVAADGKSSFIRERAGLPVKIWDYPQVALAFDVSHPADHACTSTEFHTDEGPLTTVPRREGVSGVVWMISPERATRLAKQDPATILQEMADITGAHLGINALVSPVTYWPLKGLMATQMGRDGLFLIGESAHAFPPIGAQGFNLTLRDARTLARLFDETPPQSPQDFVVLSQRYHAARITDVGFRVRMVDWLDRSLLEPFSWRGAGRIMGLTLLANVPYLRTQIMRFGMRS
jgi:2-octaprenyl-6-methoxyphenol hydroxylase